MSLRTQPRLMLPVCSQSSGVTVSTEAKTVYEEVKKDKKYRYIIYHIKDEKVGRGRKEGRRGGEERR